MSPRIRRSIVSATFICALLVSSLSASVPANAQNQSDCLSAPTSSAPQNGHWYYRTNRTTQRKCWHLGTDDHSSPPNGAQTAQDGAASNPSQSSRANVSDKESEKLYAEFLEWRDHQAGHTEGHR
jgi:hypothetical protein